MSDEIPVDELLADLGEDFDAQTDREQPLPGEEVHAVNWRTLTDEDAPAVWVELADWVDWFLQRYQISHKKVPPCWYRHGDLVEELSALHTAWKVSYSPLDGGYGPIGWHERLTVAMDRIIARTPAECSHGHQRPPDLRVAHISDDADFHAWATSAHAQTSRGTHPSGRA